MCVCVWGGGIEAFPLQESIHSTNVVFNCAGISLTWVSHSTNEVLCSRGIQTFPLWGSLHSTKEVLCLRGIQASPLQGLSTALTRYHIKGYVGNTSLRGILVST